MPPYPRGLKIRQIMLVALHGDGLQHDPENGAGSGAYASQKSEPALDPNAEL